MSITPYDGPRVGAYQVRVDYVAGDGTRTQIMKTVTRKKEAKAFEAHWNARKRAGGATLVEPSTMTVADLLADWLASKRHAREDRPHGDYAWTAPHHHDARKGRI